MVWLYKHLSNKTIVDIFFGFWGFVFHFHCWKGQNKVLKFDMMYFPNFEISASLF